MIKFNLTYFINFILLFIVEVCIAKYATGFIRHTIGDILVVILLYCFIKSFWKISVNKTIFIVLFISFCVEFLQLSNLQNLYPKELEHLLKIVLGTSFSFGDLIAYLLGTIVIYTIEKLKKYLIP